jgi:type I restriction enzyme S subunit
MIDRPALALLDDHVEFLTGFPFKSAQYLGNAREAVRLLRGDNVAQGVLRWEGAKYWPVAVRDDYSSFALAKDDVILAMDRPWIEAGLKWAWVRQSDLPCLLVQRVARLRGRNGLTTEYLRHVIGSPAFTDHVKSITTGVNVPHISGRDIKRFQFCLPEPVIQHRIASILGAYDDLIEVNRRRIAVMEEMARQLFDEWFVRFRFPGGGSTDLRQTSVGTIPGSWSVIRLGNACNLMQSDASRSDAPSVRKRVLGPSNYRLVYHDGASGLLSIRVDRAHHCDSGQPWPWPDISSGIGVPGPLRCKHRTYRYRRLRMLQQPSGSGNAS